MRYRAHNESEIHFAQGIDGAPAPHNEHHVFSWA